MCISDVAINILMVFMTKQIQDIQKINMNELKIPRYSPIIFVFKKYPFLSYSNVTEMSFSIVIQKQILYV